MLKKKGGRRRSYAKHEKVKARKSHVCAVCGGEIQTGIEYMRSVYFELNHITFAQHDMCYDLRREVSKLDVHSQHSRDKLVQPGMVKSLLRIPNVRKKLPAELLTYGDKACGFAVDSEASGQLAFSRNLPEADTIVADRNVPNPQAHSQFVREVTSMSSVKRGHAYTRVRVYAKTSVTHVCDVCGYEHGTPTWYAHIKEFYSDTPPVSLELCRTCFDLAKDVEFFLNEEEVVPEKNIQFSALSASLIAIQIEAEKKGTRGDKARELLARWKHCEEVGPLRSRGRKKQLRLQLA